MYHQKINTKILIIIILFEIDIIIKNLLKLQKMKNYSKNSKKLLIPKTKIKAANYQDLMKKIAALLITIQ